MKINLLTTYLLLFSTLFLACSKEDSTSNYKSEQKDEDIENLKYRLSKIDLNHSSSQPYYIDDLSYTYAENGKLNTIQQGGFIYQVSYPNESLIELNLVEENISNVDLTKRYSIYLKEGKIDYINQWNIYKFSDERIDAFSDSTSYTYNGNKLMKIETFDLGNSNHELTRYINFTYKDGNVTKSNSLISNTYCTSSYEYDDTPNIDLSEAKFESPVFRFNSLCYMLIYDKLGEQNQNNLLSKSIDYDDTLFIPKFTKINYDYILDEKTGLLNTIELSGTARCDSQERYPDFYPSKEFNDIKVTFEFETYQE